MESALGWLGEIFKYIGAFIPRPFLVTTIEGGVRWRRGKKIVELKPGFHIYWPLLTRIKIINVVRQAMVFTPVALTTKDKEMVSVAATLVYEISDVVRALTTIDDITSTISELGQTAIPPLTLGKTLDELLDTAENGDFEDGLNHELTEYMKNVLDGFGVRVIYCRVSDCTKTITVRLLNETGSPLMMTG